MKDFSRSNAHPLREPAEAIAALLQHINPLGHETIPTARSIGRVLAEPIRADRASPPCDVSAMDGYAIRLQDIGRQRLPVVAEALPGHEPLSLGPAQAIRIFTGAAVPLDAEAIIKRESLKESPDEIALPNGLQITPGMNIRRQGENVEARAIVLRPGCQITAAGLAAMTTFGVDAVKVHRRVRVAVIVTGDELLPAGAVPQPWQIRDSNGPALAALFSSVPWIDLVEVVRVSDAIDPLRRSMSSMLAKCDALLLTGGVSMGDRDFVPETIDALGARTLFHKLSLRPGKPMLGAVTPTGQAIFGLPGNPVSALVTARRWASIAMRKLAGMTHHDAPGVAVMLTDPDDAKLNMWWYRLVCLTEGGQAELLKNRGSGDLVSMSQSDGFIEIPPNTSGAGPFRFYPWSMM